ncbi:MAG: LTA synthase family protein [Prevotella sp.]
MSKWGVPDGPLFDYVERDINLSRSAGPALSVIQTSSSHEPFDVPVRLHRNKRLNAFAYTDMQLGRFIDWLKRSGRWKRSVVILVADHLGAYPERIDNLTLPRFQIPLIITGGAVDGHQRLEVYGSQQDIAATLLAQLGISHEDFTFSKDLLDPSIPHFAFFTIPDAFGIADSQNRLIYDNQATKIVVDEGPCKSSNLLRGKAYLQKLYDVIDNL